MSIEFRQNSEFNSKTTLRKDLDGVNNKKALRKAYLQGTWIRDQIGDRYTREITEELVKGYDVFENTLIKLNYKDKKILLNNLIHKEVNIFDLLEVRNKICENNSNDDQEEILNYDQETFDENIKKLTNLEKAKKTAEKAVNKVVNLFQKIIYFGVKGDQEINDLISDTLNQSKSHIDMNQVRAELGFGDLNEPSENQTKSYIGQVRKPSFADVSKQSRNPTKLDMDRTREELGFGDLNKPSENQTKLDMDQVREESAFGDVSTGAIRGFPNTNVLTYPNADFKVVTGMHDLRPNGELAKAFDQALHKTKNKEGWRAFQIATREFVSRKIDDPKTTWTNHTGSEITPKQGLKEHITHLTHLDDEIPNQFLIWAVEPETEVQLKDFYKSILKTVLQEAKTKEVTVAIPLSTRVFKRRPQDSIQIAYEVLKEFNQNHPEIIIKIAICTEKKEYELYGSLERKIPKEKRGDKNENTVLTDPSENTVLTDPSENTVLTDPSENTVLTDPSENTILTDPSENTVLIKPAKRRNLKKLAMTEQQKFRARLSYNTGQTVSDDEFRHIWENNKFHNSSNYNEALKELREFRKKINPLKTSR